MKAYRRSKREKLDPGAYDRTAAILWAAVSTGIFLLGLLWPIVWKRGFDALWWLAHATTYVRALVSLLYGLWLCRAAYQGARWAFVGLAFQLALDVLTGLTYRFTDADLFRAVAFLFFVARLIPLFGPKLAPPPKPAPFLPDRVVAVGFALLNVGYGSENILRISNARGVTVLFWQIVDLVQLLWFNLQLYRGHRFALTMGLVFTFLAILQILRSPAGLPNDAACCLGFLYFQARLLNLIGPKTERPRSPSELRG